MCAKNNCNGCDDCTKLTELKYTSQIIYDGDKIELPGISLVIEPCDTLNDIIARLANKINELHP